MVIKIPDHVIERFDIAAAENNHRLSFLSHKDQEIINTIINKEDC